MNLQTRTLKERFNELFTIFDEETRGEILRKDSIHVELVRRCCQEERDLKMTEYRSLLEFFRKEFRLRLQEKKKNDALKLVKPEQITSGLDQAIHPTPSNELARKLGSETTAGIEKSEDLLATLRNNIQDWQNSPLHERQLYIPLDCTDEAGTKSKADDYLLHWSTEQTRRSFLLMLGDVGTGKTTTLKHFCQQQADKFINGDPEKLALFFPLKQYNKEIDMQKALIAFCIEDYGMELPEGWSTLESYIKNGLLLICFDAFDEMAIRSTPDILEKNFAQIAELANMDGCKIILSSRSQYFTNRVQLKKLLETIDAGEQISLELFTEEQWNTYLNRFFRGNADHYKNKLNQMPGSADLLHTPLLLEIMVKELPKIADTEEINKFNLVNKYTETWLRTARNSHTTPATRRLFAEQLAWHLWTTRTDQIDPDNLKRLIEQTMPKLGVTGDLRHIDSDIRTASFLNTDNAGNYCFYHQIFADYFLAAAFIDRIKRNDSHGFGKAAVSDDVLDFLADSKTDFHPLLEWLEEVDRLLEDPQNQTEENQQKKENILKVLEKTGYDAALMERLSLIDEKQFRDSFLHDPQLRHIAKQSVLTLDQQEKPVTLLNIFDAYLDSCLTEGGAQPPEKKIYRELFGIFAWFLFTHNCGESTDTNRFKEYLHNFPSENANVLREIAPKLRELSCFVCIAPSTCRFVHPLVRSYTLASFAKKRINSNNHSGLGRARLSRKGVYFLTIMEPEVRFLREWFDNIIDRKIDLAREPWLGGIIATLLYSLRDQFDYTEFGKRYFVAVGDTERQNKLPLQEINLQGAILEQVDLEDALLAKADLSECKLCYASFRNADLRECVFAQADLRGVDFTGANIDGADFTDTITDNAIGLSR